jgi:hypothetical protein
MGGAGNVWNNVAVYPLFVTMGLGMGVFTYRVCQWIAMDQDIQVTKKYRKADVADSDFLLEHGSANYNNVIRKYMRSSTAHLVFPEPTSLLAPVPVETD